MIISFCSSFFLGHDEFKNDQDRNDEAVLPYYTVLLLIVPVHSIFAISPLRSLYTHLYSTTNFLPRKRCPRGSESQYDALECGSLPGWGSIPGFTTN